jgi:Protein phosphatase 2C
MDNLTRRTYAEIHDLFTKDANLFLSVRSVASLNNPSLLALSTPFEYVEIENSIGEIIKAVPTYIKLLLISRVEGTNSEKNIDNCSLCFQSSHFSLNKTESTLQQNEDAVYVSDQNLIYAISDGASSSPDAKTWSEMLVTASKDFGTDESKFENLLPGLKIKWETDWRRRKEENPSSDWWMDESHESLNAATLCVLSFSDTSNCLGNKKWTSLIVGDSCLFQIRENKLINTSPLLHSSEFNNSPELICSNERIKDKLVKHKNEGFARKGDIFILATDAVSSWILGNYEKNNLTRLNLMLDQNLDEQQFKKLIMDERLDRSMEDDDSTIVIVRVL